MTRTASTEAKPVITVLGASGFIGTAVTAALADRPIRVRAVARGPVALPGGPFRAEVEVRTADLTSPAVLDEAIAGSDTVIHLVLHSSGWRGAESDPASERANVGVLADLVDSLRVRRRQGPPPIVVFAGSVSQVGVPPGTPINGTEPDRPNTSYDRQKQAAEHMLMDATAEGVLRGVSLRLPTVFGHSRSVASTDRGVLATMVGQASAGKALTMWHDGRVERDLLHVDDVAAAFLAALDNVDSVAGRHWVLGTGRGERLGDVFRTIARLVSVHTGRDPVPVVSVPPPAQATVTDSHSVVVDSSAFRSATGWRPTVRLENALGHMVATHHSAT
jgi:nucleoside-diphosphate-sugar epimerase